MRPELHAAAEMWRDGGDPMISPIETLKMQRDAALATAALCDAQAIKNGKIVLRDIETAHQARETAAWIDAILAKLV